MRKLSERWQSGVLWLGWNLLGMLGLWAVGCFVFFYLDPVPWFKLVDKGQLFAYSVGFLVQAMYILTKEARITALPHRPWITLGTVCCLLLCAVFFMGTIQTEITDNSVIADRIWWFRSLSIVIFTISMAMGVWVTVAAQDTDLVDIEKLSQSNIDRFEDSVSNI